MFSSNALYAKMQRSPAGKKYLEAGYAKRKTDNFSREAVKPVS